MDLRLRTRAASEATVVEVAGEVELHNTPQLRGELLRACDSDRPRVVVDLSAVTFIDSSGIGVLVGALKRARERNGSFVLVCLQPRVKRVFEITGLTRAMNLFDDLDTALAFLNRPADAPEDQTNPQEKD